MQPLQATPTQNISFMSLLLTTTTWRCVEGTRKREIGKWYSIIYIILLLIFQTIHEANILRCYWLPEGMDIDTR